MSGAVSLAAARAVPLTAQGTSFPPRDLLIFLTFCVILAPLVVQGLNLPALIRSLGIENDHSGEREELEGRIEVAQATLQRLYKLEAEDWVRGHGKPDAWSLQLSPQPVRHPLRW